MKTIIEYEKCTGAVCFESVKDKQCFYSGNVLYMKILQQDLDAYKINNININAISVLNAGLTFFQQDETVNIAIREYKIIKK